MDCKCKFDSEICSLNQKWNNETRQCEFKTYRTCKKDYSWNTSTCIFENSKYLRSITDNSVIACDKIIYVMGIASRKMTNTTSKNVMSTALINCYNKKVRNKFDCYILHKILLEIILLLIITIICYHYANHRSETKKAYYRTNNIKCRIMNLKKFILKIVFAIISMAKLN